MPVEVPKDKWTGSVLTITVGATAAEGGSRTKGITVGGQTTMPFMHFEGTIPNKPVIALEIKDRAPDDWSTQLMEAWGDVTGDPARWAKAGEEAGAEA